MGLRDFLHKKDRLSAHDDDNAYDPGGHAPAAAPEFTFVRSDTSTQEIIHPPSYDGPEGNRGFQPFVAQDGFLTAAQPSSRSRSVSLGGAPDDRSSPQSRPRSREHIHRRLSQRLGFRRTESSDNIPDNLPEIHIAGPAATGHGAGGAAGARGKGGAKGAGGVRLGDTQDPDTEAQWEQRATILAASRGGLNSPGGGGGGSPSSLGTFPRSPIPPISPISPFFKGGEFTATPAAAAEGGGGKRNANDPADANVGLGFGRMSLEQRPDKEEAARVVAAKKPDDGGAVSAAQLIDADIQEAIRLHETGDLQASTGLFARLADLDGANNPLSQVMYGLALRHGWGCEPDPAGAVRFLNAAAANAATVEQLALQAGLKKGGAAKGELVLAIFELANCFRHGWGIQRDPIAAKQYYETAANLGDTDAMNEVAWCYLEGFGCKKDKFAAARYYRLAEKSGSKTIGNTWIWKEKYDPGYDGRKKKK